MQTEPLPQPSAEYLSWDYRLQLMGLGFAFYAAVFLLSHIISAALSHTYKFLPAKEKVFWSLAAMRAVFGIQCSVAGLRALTEDSVVSRNRMQGQDDWTWFIILTATGFFVFENLAFHTSNVIFQSFDLKLATHHLFSLSSYAGLVVWDNFGHYVPMVLLLLEMSTPFTCVSWMLMKAGLATTLLWRANQWLMIHAFHCRMVLTYYVWWVFWTNWTEFSTRLAPPLFVILITSLALITFILNPIWMHKKTMQLCNPVDWNFGNKSAPLDRAMQGLSESVKPHTS